MSKSSVELNPEDFRCSSCKNYLSCSPIYILPDGKDVCENCSLLNTDINYYRHLTLEKILANVSFLCENKKHGCPHTYKFGMLRQHNDNCKFVPIHCTFSKTFNCGWMGPIGQFSQHTITEHPSIVFSIAKFRIELNCNKDDAFIVSNNDEFFLVRYVYNSNNFTLRYSIAFYGNVRTQLCRIQLTNEDDSNFMMHFKGCKPESYDDKILEADIASSLNLMECMKFLGNPTLVTISIDVPKIESTNAEVNYDILNAHTCTHCLYYLIVPIFQASGLICNNCHYNVECEAIDTNSHLSTKLKSQNYPCRWNDCTSIIKGNLIGTHEIVCEHRKYSCVRCSYYSTAPGMKNHMASHDIEYFENQIVTEISLTQPSVSVCTFVRNEFITIIINNKCIPPRHTVFIETSRKTTRYDDEKITYAINFTHAHCRISRRIETSSKLIQRTELPICFKKDMKYIATITAY